ncbi:MAG: alkaline phosphatase [Candidatus Limnocylindrales bacterium]
MKRPISLALALSMTASLGVLAPATAEEPAAEAKSAILLVGDGMSLAQVYSAQIYAEEVLDGSLVLPSIADTAVTTTHSADSMVTDSAAAGTAIHAGHKVENGSINVLSDGAWTYTLGQAAREAGKSVGVLSTARITHATPASVYGHDADRDAENLFAEQMVEFMPEVALGGGARHFLPEGKREDGRNLIDEMVGMGYTNVTNAEELRAVDTENTAHLLGLFTSSHMSYEVDRVNGELDEPSLAEMTAVALDVLDNDPDGFFVSIEAGRIDHACHDHDITGSIWDTLAFDEAVRVALDYQAEHPEVLVIATADHETAGLSLGHGTEYFTTINELSGVTCSLASLSDMISEDPANAVALAEGCGLVLSDDHIAMLGEHPPEAEEVEGMDLGYAYTWAHYVLALAEAEMAGIEFGPWAHSGMPVITYAVGPGADMFTGTIDNTELPQYVAASIGATLEAPSMP